MGPPAQTVIGFAHRGARLEHRDNTLAGFARALELGASGLESDAWVTADGVAVLDHDGVVRRGLRRRPISTVRRGDLPPHIPTLADLLALPGAPQAQLSLDMKDPAALDPVLGAAGASRPLLWLCSAKAGVLAGWRQRDPDVRLVHSSGLRRIGPGAGEVGRHARRLAATGVAALNLRAPEWTPEIVASCHDAGVRAFAWDAQDAGTITSLATMGIDAVYSDHVGTMVATLRAGGWSEDVEVAERPDA